MNKNLTPAEYKAIHEFLESQAGIRLGTGKEYLVISRLSRLFAVFELDGFGDLVSRLGDFGSSRIQAAVVDAMTTNETFWFRDAAHFRALVDGILSETKPLDLRIWSAAASTGQEAYTVAITLQDGMQEGRLARSMRYEIVGTDISATALKEAQGGVYCGISAARGLTDLQRQRYFREQDGCIELLPQYRQRVNFRQFNLLKSFESLGRFDVIYCRNVLIYFSRERKRDIIERMARSLRPGGHLFLGSTESISGHEDLFEMRNLAGGLVYRVRR
ncbi:MAG: methyltransferase domain-containing protein [Chromatiaceae bacterium]|nr:methyltransferase domain-containing protein [Gammaproteobacteria bacterium]MCP5304034.1 methyltransferase domain-containing protein [Chromatiaceae bacterium]MCP5313760.1 methyltransferase domain-containing protein [Chromatiaceae bacterium]